MHGSLDSVAFPVPLTAYSTDITPTLYRLLGHDPSQPAPFFGESLAQRPGAPPPARAARMVAARISGWLDIRPAPISASTARLRLVASTRPVRALPLAALA